MDAIFASKLQWTNNIIQLIHTRTIGVGFEKFDD